MDLFFSRPCIAIYFAHFASNTGIYVFLTQLPSFLKDVLRFDLKNNGAVSALPYIASALLNTIFAIISDKLMTSGRLTRTNSRRLFGFIGMFVPILALIGLSFVTCEQPVLAVILLVIGISFTYSMNYSYFSQ
jgi:ACS family sodium-dependent inorganic phosphate cotransporter-like MFS transporter 5